MRYGTFVKALDGAEAAVPMRADEQTPVLAAAEELTKPTTRSFASPLAVAIAVLGLAACGVALAFGRDMATAVQGPTNFRALATAGQEPTNFRAFVCYFSPKADPRSGHQFIPGVYDHLKMALASSKNFGAPVDLVTTGDDTQTRAALSDQAIFGHVNVVNIELCGENDVLPGFKCPSSFVDILEQLKVAYVAAHPGESCAYFEADMVIQPGAGDVVRKALAENDFDVGYTYMPEVLTAYYDEHCGPMCGSINSGFILWKDAKPATNEWNMAVLGVLYDWKPDGSFSGAENQGATDKVIGQRQVPPWTIVEQQGKNIRVLSLPYEQYNFMMAPNIDGTDPDNYMGAWETACCTRRANPILHFYANKTMQLSKCCQDLIYGS